MGAWVLILIQNGNPDSDLDLCTRTPQFGAIKLRLGLRGLRLQRLKHEVRLASADHATSLASSETFVTASIDTHARPA